MAVAAMPVWPVQSIYGLGQFYDELFASGLELGLPLGTQLVIRDERKTVFVFNDLGLVSAEFVETQEFDGWEIYDASLHETFRHESGGDAAAAILRIVQRRTTASVGREAVIASDANSTEKG